MQEKNRTNFSLEFCNPNQIQFLVFAKKIVPNRDKCDPNH